MKTGNIFKINVVVNIYGEKSLVTVEEPFTVEKLREELDIPDSWELFCSWVPLRHNNFTKQNGERNRRNENTYDRFGVY